MNILAGSTDVPIEVEFLDSTAGTPETGITSATAGLAISYRRVGGDNVAISLSNLSAIDDAHSDGGLYEIGNGLYRLDLPDAAVAAGASRVVIHGTATGMVMLPKTINLVAYNPQDNVRLGLTALPNAAADAAGGLPISDAGGLDLDAQFAKFGTVANLGGGATFAQNLADLAGTGFSTATDSQAALYDAAAAIASAVANNGSGISTVNTTVNAMKLIIDNLPNSGALTSLAQGADITTIINRLKNTQRHWYINSEANGNNDGTSPTDAWETLADFDSASAAGLQPGDILHVEGTFTAEQLNLDVNSIRVYMRGTIDGTGGTNEKGINVLADFNWIEGGEVRDIQGDGTNGYGIFSDNRIGTVVRNVKVHGCTFQGILFRSARGGLIDHAIVYNNDAKGIGVTNELTTDPDLNNSNVVVTRCEMFGNGRFGLQMGGANGKENGRGLEAYDNVIYGNGIGCKLESAYYVKLHHNRFWDNDLVGEPVATQTELVIEDGFGCEVFENDFLGKDSDRFIDFWKSANSPDGHKVFRNRIFGTSTTAMRGIRVQINGTDGLEFTDNFIYVPGTTSANQAFVVAQATNGKISGNVIVGGYEGVKLNPVSAVAITATDWTIEENTFDGQALRAIYRGTGANSNATVAGNRYWNMASGTWVTLRPSGSDVSYGTAGGAVLDIATLDSTYRTDAPNYRGPTTGSFIARDYTIRPVSTDQIALKSTVDNLNDLGVSDVQSASATGAAAAIAAARLDELMAAALDSEPATGSLFGDLTADNSGTQRFTAPALALAPTGDGGGSGTGANVVTVTVNDGTNPLQNVIVAIWDGSMLRGRSEPTNVDGVTELSIDDGTFTLAATKGGYTHTPEEIVVSGVTPITVSMTAVTITPSAGDRTTLWTVCLDEDNQPEEGVSCTLTMKVGPPDETGVFYDRKPRIEVSDADGLVEFTDEIPGASYSLSRGGADVPFGFTVSPDAGATWPIPSNLGKE